MLIRWTELAEADLDAVVDYRANESVANALAMDARIRDRVRMLSDFPELGREGRFSNTRELVVPHDRCVIVYRLEDGEVHVLRVIHGGQEWPAHL